MGACFHCGQPAGFLRRRHPECDAKHQSGRELFRQLVARAVAGRLDVAKLGAKYLELRKSHYLSDAVAKPVLVEAWENEVERAFEDGVLSESREACLVSVAEFFALTQNDVNKEGNHSRFVKGAVLRELMEGKIPERVNPDSRLPFDFQIYEKPIWVFYGVRHFEQKTSTEYIGGSTVASVRVAKGVYLRTSAFKVRPLDRLETVDCGKGLLAVTNKHIYFSSRRKSFSVRLDKIVTFKPFPDGIGILREATTAKPQTFLTGDGWFTYNLVRNAANLRIDAFHVGEEDS